jgi:hypothetical protein
VCLPKSWDWRLLLPKAGERRHALYTCGRSSPARTGLSGGARAPRSAAGSAYGSSSPPGKNDELLDFKGLLFYRPAGLHLPKSGTNEQAYVRTCLAIRFKRF